MFYSDLLKLKRDRGDKVSIENLRSLQLGIPDDVLEQFCSDHAFKKEFQEQYGHLNLKEVSWQLKTVEAGVLILANIYPPYQNWTNNVELRLRHFDTDSWKCIDSRPAVIEQWATTHTWLRPPILLEGILLGLPCQLHLAEGHTRIGILRGLIRRGILPSESVHKIWLGTSG